MAATKFVSDVQSMLAAATADSNHAPGVIFAAADKSGKLLAHEASGVKQAGSKEPIDKDMLCWMASCTKLITAIACMQLVEKQKLSLDSPAHEVLPELKKLEDARGNKKPITLRHLLTHTAGMSYPFFNKDTKNWFDENKLEAFGARMQSIKGPLNDEPGSHWEYGTSIDWAGQMVEKVSGMDLDAYFKKEIFEPLGIKRITFKPETGLPDGKSVIPQLVGMNFKSAQGDAFTVKPQSHVIELEESKVEIMYGGAGAYGNAAEFVQILVALLNDGTHPVTKSQILTPTSVEELFRDQLSEDRVKDLDTPIVASMPDLSNDFSILPGATKQWTLAGLKTYDGPEKKHSFVWWAGIANHYWFINRDLGVCAMIQTQIFPFFDSTVVPLFFHQLQPALHALAS